MRSFVGVFARLYDTHGEKIRYLGVGVWNTVFNLALFNALLLVFGRHLYLVWFWVAWVVCVGQSTVTMKYFAFRRKGRLLPQIGRAFVIYLPAQGLSTGIMWLGVEIAHLLPQIAQLFTVVVTTIFSYVGHKYFTFRVPLEVVEVPPEEMIEGAGPRA
jgi:putative flippase GtrA